MADLGESNEKQHPFQNFDSSKLKITPRSGAQPARDNPTTTEELEPPETPDPDQPVDKPDAQPKAGTEKAPPDENQPEIKTPEDAPKTGDEPAAKEGDKPSEYTEQDFHADVSTFLGETTQGRITSSDQITAILTENATLKEQLKNKELEFPSERAKKVYEFAVKNDGNELAAAGQYLRVQGLDLAKLSPKDKQFELFALNNPELSPESAKEVFEALYAKEFTDTENDVVQKYEHDKRTREAEKKILAMQDEFTKAPERTASAPEQVSAEDMEKITTGIDQSLSDFGGLVMQFGENPEDQVKVPMVAEEVSAFREALIDPNKFLKRILDSSMVNGQFSNEAYRDTMFRLWNIDRVVEEIGTNRFTAGQVAIVKDRKNAVEPKGTTGNAAPPKDSYAQTMAKAVKASETKR